MTDPSDVGCQPPVQERQGAGNQEQTLDLSQQPPITFCGALLIPVKPLEKDVYCTTPRVREGWAVSSGSLSSQHNTKYA
ncbi:hypothetical protein BSL78_27001 [Apostichopus japonicus]|uniref:Uncharacterized protein n=1 Tax=Stichopus japonicus TaxID=307972 RepID=A0A2G8JK93_STIJA|nr:hypothetical protein BSL78_27001 [Apostichopus japonicus]